MASIKTSYVPSVYGVAANRYTFSNPFYGTTNFSEFASKFMNVKFVSDTVGNRVNYSCSNFSSKNLENTPIRWDAWKFIVGELANNINNQILEGVGAVNSDPAFLLSLFVNVGYLKTNHFVSAGYSDFVSYWEDPTHFVPGRFSPYRNPPMVINNRIAEAGANSIVNGVNTIVVNGLSDFVNKEAKIDIVGINGEGNYTSLITGGVSAQTIDSGGTFSGSVTVNYTSGIVVPIFSIQAFGIDDYASNIFSANINIGNGYNGVNAELQIYDPDNVNIWS